MNLLQPELIELLSQIKQLKNLHDNGMCKFSHHPNHNFFFKPDDIKFEGEYISLFTNLENLKEMGFIKETHFSDIGEFGIMYTI